MDNLKSIDLPNSPGVYKFLSSKNKILYVGKSKNLKKRVKSYFQKDQNKKISNMIKETTNIEKNLKIESLGITIEDHESGVKVISVDDINSSLQNGDIITEVNREVISNMNSFEELVNSLEKTGRSSLLLKIIRDDEQNWVTIKFKKN